VARQAVSVAYRDASPPLQPADATTAPRLLGAAAADLLVCARRFHLRTTARLFPPGPAARPSLSEEAAGEPAHLRLRHGSLAGQLLAELDPRTFLGGEGTSADGELEARLHLCGVDADGAPARELRAHLRRLLTGLRRAGSVLGALLAGGPGVARGVPYELTVAGGAAQLWGRLDLLHVADSAEQGRAVTILDYHYCCAPQREGPLHAQRRALLGLVAARLYPDAARLQTGLCFLREAEVEPTLRPVEPTTLAATEAALLAAAPSCTLSLTAALRLPVLPERTCGELGCEYAPLCHPAQPGLRT